METFDQLVEQDLHEFFRGARRELSKIHQKALASISSTQAGKLKTQDAVDQYHREFEQFCGRMNVKKPKIDDLVDFVLMTRGAEADDATKMRMIFNDDLVDSQNKDKIEAIIRELDKKISTGDIDKSFVNGIYTMIQNNLGDEHLFRFLLHNLSRKYPKKIYSNVLKPIRKYIGYLPTNKNILDEMFLKLVIQDFQQTNKKDNKDNGKEDFHPAAKESIERRIFRKDLESLGMTFNDLSKIKKMGSFDEAEQYVSTKYRGKEIQIVSVLLQVIATKPTVLLQSMETIYEKGNEINENFETELVRIIKLMGEPYLETFIINKISRLLPKGNTAIRGTLLAAVIMVIQPLIERVVIPYENDEKK